MYEIKQEYIELENEISYCDGEMTPELQEKMIINKAELEGKTVAYIVMIKQRKSRADMIKQEIKRLQDMVKAIDREIDFFEYGLLEAVNMFGSYNAGTFKVSLRKTESVSITDEQALEDRFLRTKLEPNKVAIKDALNAGEQVTGAVITINQNLNIR